MHKLKAQQDRKNSALRVSFQTDTSFDREDAHVHGLLKKRALRCIIREVNYPCVENNNYPDIVLMILRRADGDRGWMLRKVTR